MSSVTDANSKEEIERRMVELANLIGRFPSTPIAPERWKHLMAYNSSFEDNRKRLLDALLLVRRCVDDCGEFVKDAPWFPALQAADDAIWKNGPETHTPVGAEA